MNFYLSAVDELLRHPDDQPSIGLILCKTQNRLIAEYALRDLHKPMGAATYRPGRGLPADLQGSLPTIEDLEARSGEMEYNDDRLRTSDSPETWRDNDTIISAEHTPVDFCYPWIYNRSTGKAFSSLPMQQAEASGMAGSAVAMLLPVEDAARAPALGSRPSFPHRPRYRAPNGSCTTASHRRTAL